MAGWREVGGVDLVAVYNRTRSRAEEIAKQFDVPAVYGDAETLLATEPLDFVDIITDVDTHSHFVQLAASHGLPVICQKPLAPDLSTAGDMLQRCQEAGVPLLVHGNWRWQHPLRGKDGWMGVGGLTLDWLDGGEARLQGVPFKILDPAGGGLACIALRSHKVQKTGDSEIPAKVVVPVNKKLTALYFLHGCGWAKHAKVGQYRIVYDDDTVSAIDITPFGAGSEHLDVAERMRTQAAVQDWWPAVTQVANEHLRDVIIANPDNLADKRYLYNLQWMNSTPAKMVRHIELESDPSASTSLFVVAITAARAE